MRSHHSGGIQQHLRELDEQLLVAKPRHWCRAFSQPGARQDWIVGSMVEPDDDLIVVNLNEATDI
ncbi:MAG: hypothetical protein ACFCVA_13315 [Gammaproteobacteria bacterium]